MQKKTIHLSFLIGVMLSSCATLPSTAEPSHDLTTPVVEQAVLLPSATSTATQAPTSTPTATPTQTLAPTATSQPTRTPAPSATPFGGSGGEALMFINLNLVRFPYPDLSDLNVILTYEDLINEFQFSELSTSWEDAVSPSGKQIAFWNCATKHCDTKRGNLYILTTDHRSMASVMVPGHPYFVGWSSDEDRLLYYLSSTMADEFFLIKTQYPGFGEVISLGRLNAMSWASDKQTLFAQKGNKVFHLDKDGKELETFECNFNNACMASPSPDGKRFAGIQKFVPTGTGNPVITISNQDFTEKKSIFISDDKALILFVNWLPDNQHIVVFGQTARQRVRRFWRLDYLSIIDVDSGEERVIKLDIPEDSEWFAPCGLTPDGRQLVYLGAGGRVKQEGRILMSGRKALIFPLETEDPDFRPITDIEGAWESCPNWLQ
jgi:hypothetical protein